MLPEDVWPVSVNDHWIEPPRLWSEGLPKARASVAPRIVATPDGGEAWQIGPEVLPLATYLPSAMYRSDPARPVQRLADLAAAASDPAARLASMDRDRVSVHTIFPHVFLGFAGERLRKLGDATLWAECVRAYNNFLLKEFCGAAPERLAGVAILPLADPAAMVAEIERVAPLGARAISLPHNPVPLGVDSYHRDSWVRVLDAADAAGLAILVHINSDGSGWVPRSDPAWRPVPTMVTVANFDVMHTACDLAFSPLLTERPQRRVLLLEANLAWMPYIEERLDFATRGRHELAPKGRPASRVMHEQIYGSFLSDPVAIADRARIGVERFFWQADYPHVDSLWPESRSDLAGLLSNVPDAEARRIAADNARQFLRMT